VVIALADLGLKMEGGTVTCWNQN